MCICGGVCGVFCGGVCVVMVAVEIFFVMVFGGVKLVLVFLLFLFCGGVF